MFNITPIVLSTITAFSLNALNTPYLNENGYTLTFTSESNFTLKISEETTIDGIYIVKEDETYELYVDNELYAVATLNNEDLTFTLDLNESILDKVSGALDSAIDSVKEFLDTNQYAQYVMYAIQWAINSGLLVALFGVFLKYRKYKAKSTNEINDEVKKVVEENLKKLSEELLKENADTILKALDKFNGDVETIKKALVLAQDKTSEGKKALLELLSENNSEELKEVANKVIAKIDNEKKANERILNDFKNSEYKSIEEEKNNIPVD